MPVDSAVGAIVHAPWFITIDAIGTVAFALSGIAIARAERYSLLGALILAALPAIGGGLVMDLIAGRSPVAILASPTAMIAIIVTVVLAKLVMQFIDYASGRLLVFYDLAYLYVRLQERVAAGTFLVFFDSIGLASFTVTGVFTAIQYDCRPLIIWAPMFGVLNAAFGAILRDVFRADAHNPIMKGSLYAEIAIVWSLLLLLFILFMPTWAEPVGVAFTLVGVSATRMMLYHRKIQAPMF